MSHTPRWARVTSVENIPLHEGRAVNTDGRQIAIFHLPDRFLTIDNQCPHKGGPLCDGIVAGSIVVCPLHGRRFDLETGLAVRASEPACVATYPTRVEQGIVLVDLDSPRRILDDAPV